MELLFVMVLSYIQIGRILALNHAQQDPISRPFYVGKPNGNLINLFLWPLGSRRYRFAWFLIMFFSTSTLFFLCNFILEQWIENSIYRLLILLFFSLTPVTYFFISMLFALVRFAFSGYKFRRYFIKALLQMFKNQGEVSAFILDKNPLIQDEALRPSLMEMMPGAPKRKKIYRWVAMIYLFVDSITWLSGFLQTLSGDSKDLHPSNAIDEQTAVSYASQVTSLSRE